MKRLLWVIPIVLLAIPASAQDDFGFGGTISASDLEALLGGGGGNSGGNRGGRGNNFQNLIPDPELMTTQLKDLLRSQNAPLSKDQEKALKELFTTERASIEETITSQFGNRGNNRGNNNNNDNRNRFNPSEIMDQIEKATQKHNQELLTAMKASLSADQVNLLTKAEKDKKKVCTVVLDQIDFKRIKDQQNNAGFNGGGFGGGFGGFDGGFGGGGFDGGFGGGFPGGGGGRGGFDRGRGGFLNNVSLPNRASCTTRDSTVTERLAPIVDVMAKGKKPLTPELETEFVGLIEGQLAALQQELAANEQMVSLLDNLNRSDETEVNPQQLRNNIASTILQQLGISNNSGNRGNRGGGNFNPGNNPGNRGNNAGNRGNNGGTRGDNGQQGNRGRNNFNIESELQQRHEALLDKVVAMLNPDQQPIVRKLKYQEIRARGGAEEIRGILEEEGTPLTAQQYNQVQSLFATANQAIRQYAEEMATLEIDALKPEDLKPPPPADKDAPVPNPNNVNSNPKAQQIVAKLLPRVSVRNATLEKATMDSIMKLLTPEQVASYKLSQL